MPNYTEPVTNPTGLWILGIVVGICMLMFVYRLLKGGAAYDKNVEEHPVAENGNFDDGYIQLDEFEEAISEVHEDQLN